MNPREESNPWPLPCPISRTVPSTGDARKFHFAKGAPLVRVVYTTQIAFLCYSSGVWGRVVLPYPPWTPDTVCRREQRHPWQPSGVGI